MGNQGEKEKIYQWTCENFSETLQDIYFKKNDKKCMSCFEKRLHQGKYCREYVFCTVPELKEELGAMWKEDEIMKCIEKAVIVACMKNKIQAADEEKKDKGSKVNQLDPFIYIF